ncbi:Polycystin-1 [Manis pentadactyla]|nr:Polycystin-1 [Manis pentadactyla]
MGHVLGTEEDGLSLVSPSLPTKYFSASDEDLIRQILAEGASSLAPTQDAQAEADPLPGLSHWVSQVWAEGRLLTLHPFPMEQVGCPHVLQGVRMLQGSPEQGQQPCFRAGGHKMQAQCPHGHRANQPLHSGWG